MLKDKRPMTVIRIDPKLHHEVKIAAAKRRTNMSAFTAEALREKLARKAGA
jgi:predicted HicB family RNase H-like nuclease